MKARLTDGSIIELPKDCHCVGLHDGPHWIHADELEHKMNREILNIAKRKLESEPDIALVLLDRFAEVEIIRLQAKEREMRRQKIDGLIC